MSTSNYNIATLSPNQDQKEVTINEALHKIDALLASGAIDKDMTEPPVSPSDGDVYLVSATAINDWAAYQNQIAYYYGGWNYVVPLEGLTVWVIDENLRYIHRSGVWVIDGMVARADGSYFRGSSIYVEEVGLTGSPHTTSLVIPTRVTVFGVYTRVTEVITGGASSIAIGISGQTSKFGSGIGVGVDNTNEGIISPEATYSTATVIITPNSGSFTGGNVKLWLNYIDGRGGWD